MSEPVSTPMETIIAPNTRIKGEISASCPVRIAGQFEGQITSSDFVEVTPDGLVDGAITAADIEIQGTVRGNIVASRVCRLSSTARIHGELRAACLAIAEGAAFVGRISVGPDTAAIADTIAEVPATPTETPEPFEPDNTSPVGPLTSESTPAPAPDPHHPQPTIQVVPQNLQPPITRAPRIIKAAHASH